MFGTSVAMPINMQVYREFASFCHDMQLTLPCASIDHKFLHFALSGSHNGEAIFISFFFFESYLFQRTNRYMKGIIY